MPNCPKCKAEVDEDQKTCMWCGEELSGAVSSPAPPRHAAPPAPAPRTAPSSQTVVSPGGGLPSIEDARSLAKRGDLEGALMLFQRILEARPNDQEGLFGIGGVYFKRGEYKRAAESWLKLKALNPAYPNIDGWVSKVQEMIPSSQTNIAPPAPAAPPRPSRPASTPRIPAPGGEDEDWRRQSVRVGSDVDIDNIPEPEAPKAKEPTKPKVSAEQEKDDLARWMGGKLPAWVTPAGWGLALLYAAIVGLIYF